MIMYYDRQGNPIKGTPNDPHGTLVWGNLFENKDYKIVRQEYTPLRQYWISTVWLGIDHSFSSGPPLIFESMVFDKRPDQQKTHLFIKNKASYSPDVDMQRYHTEQQAIIGHQLLVKKWTGIENRSYNVSVKQGNQ